MRLTDRNQQIEGLRGLSILFVIFYHLIYRYNIIYQNGNEFKQDWLLISRWGQIGVLAFLIISTWYLYPNKTKQFSIIKELKHKYIKLWPGYFLCITITFLLSIPCNNFLIGRAVNLKTYLINTTMLEGFLPRIDYVDGAHWYLTTLLLITFWLLFIDKIWKRNCYAYMIWLFLCIILFRLSAPWDYIGKVLAAEYSGVVIFVIFFKKIDWSNFHILWRKKIIEIIGLLLAIIYTSCVKDIIYTYIMFIIFMIFLLCYKKKLIVFETPFLVFTGKISYPLYLIHQNLSYIIENFLTTLFEKYSYMYIIPAFLISYLLAYIIYIIIQNFGNILIRK